MFMLSVHIPERNHPWYNSLNFISFATKYKLVKNKLSAQPCNTIPRSFPVYSSNAKGPNFGLYCKYQLLWYKPWQTTQDNAWGDQPGSNEIYITSWKIFLKLSMQSACSWLVWKTTKFTKRIWRSEWQWFVLFRTTSRTTSRTGRVDAFSWYCTWVIY